MAETEDLNRLIADLNSGAKPSGVELDETERDPAVWPGAARVSDEISGADGSEPDPRLDRWLAAMVARKGSDLLLVADLPPVLRRGSSIEYLGSDKLDGAEIERALLPAMKPG